MFLVVCVVVLWCVGLSYESEVHRDVMVAMEKIVEFVQGEDEEEPSNLVEVYFDYHSRCGLSEELYNFKELECVFGGTPLRWLINENLAQLEFDAVMRSGDDFVDYVAQQKELDTDIMSHSMCRYPPNLTMLNEYKTPLTKTRGRCAHGGHSKVQQ